MGGARQLLLTATIVLVCTSGLRAQSRTENAWPGSSTPPTAVGQSRIEWVESWAEAQALAARHHRLILVHFWSPDCAPCWKLERSVFNQPECIRALSANYVPWKVNVVDNPDVARDLRVQRWPTDVILAANGTEIYRGGSPADANRYIATLDQIAAHARLGMPADVSAGPEYALAPGQTGTNSTGYQAPADQPPSTAYQPPRDYQPNNTIYGPPSSQSPASGYGGPALAGNAASPPVQPGAESRQAPEYVTNQWVTPQSPTSPQPAAEQRASYTAPSGGEFQPPTASMPSAPTGVATGQFPVAPAAPPAMPTLTTNPAAAGPPAGDMGSVPAAPGAPNAGHATLGPPIGVEQPSAPPATPAADVGLDGYCPVTLVEQEKWVKGDPKWGARHRGRLYLFTGPEAQQKFLDNYDKYAPALSGFDPVKYSDQGTLVDGKRAHGVFYRSQIFLFADEAALQQFWSAPERYASTVRAEQERSAMRAREMQR